MSSKAKTAWAAAAVFGIGLVGSMCDGDRPWGVITYLAGIALGLIVLALIVRIERAKTKGADRDE